MEGHAIAGPSRYTMERREDVRADPPNVGTPASRSAAPEGWRPDTETQPGKWRIGGGVPEGKGVMPIGLVGQKGQSLSHPAIEDARWSSNKAMQDWLQAQSGEKPKSTSPTPTSDKGKGKGKAGAAQDDLPAPNHDSRQWACVPQGSCQACPPDSVRELVGLLTLRSDADNPLLAAAALPLLSALWKPHSSSVRADLGRQAGRLFAERPRLAAVRQGHRARAAGLRRVRSELAYRGADRWRAHTC